MGFNSCLLLFMISGLLWWSEANVSRSDMEGLQLFFESMGGVNWQWRYPLESFGSVWNFTTNSSTQQYVSNPCNDNWQGICCSSIISSNLSDHCSLNVNVNISANYIGVAEQYISVRYVGTIQIIGIILPSFNLRGSLNSNLFNISTLKVLSLPGNIIDETIPASILNLPDLVWLNLQDNKLHGTLPSFVFNLSKLIVLDLSFNQYSGTISNLVGDLRNVTILNFANNLLTGTIPEEIYSLVQLNQLYLDNNGLHGDLSQSFSSLQNMSILGLQGNHFAGTVPTVFGQLTTLVELYLNDNSFNGIIPSDLGKLTRLLALYLNDNSFTIMPSELGSLRNLKILNVESNTISGTIPTTFGQLSKLSELLLNNNRFYGPIPAELMNFVSIKELSLHDNRLTGGIPSLIGSLKSLNYLYLSDNPLGGHIPTSIQFLTSLNYLEMHQNELSGPIPSEIGLMINLTEFYGYGNKLAGTIPSTLGYLTGLTYIDLDSNQLTGGIDAQFSNLVHLNYLDLHGNLLNGTITTSIGKMTSLNTLYLYENHLRGAIPTEIGQLKNLNILELYQNRLRDHIPSSIGFLTNLKTLDFHQNFLNGSIPSSIGILGNLTELYLNENLLIHSIPSQIGGLTSLTTLSLFENILTGSIPTTVGALLELQVLNLYENFLDGCIPSTIGLMKAAASIDLSVNLLACSIPTTIGQLKVSNLILNANMLEGSIPSELGQIQILSKLYLSGNLLTGDIPSDIGRLSNLIYLELNNNLLHGTIPHELGYLESLSVIDLIGNLVYGNIPTAIGNMSSLSAVYLSQNLLTGNIPTSVGLLTGLTYGLYLNDNYLSGEIPSEVGFLQSLNTLELEDNNLHGVLPSELSLLTYLKTILLHANFFSGSPTNSFSVSQSFLSTVDISDNHFTGSLPSSVFNLPAVVTVAMAKNCFSGTLPDNICNCGDTIVTMALDGLTAACRHKLWFNSYTVTKFIHSTIPSCLYSMPSVQVLQLSGNGFSGRLPDSSDYQLGSSLKNLSLSRNRLNGHISDTFQDHGYRLLDLSYNRISGTISNMNFFILESNFSIPATQELENEAINQKQLILQINRLSGPLPVNFFTAENINVVTGNLFGCLPGYGLPLHDPGSLEAECGSNELYDLLESWAWCLVIVLLSLLLIYVLFVQQSYCVNGLTINILQGILSMISYYSAIETNESFTNLLPITTSFVQLMTVTKHQCFMFGAIIILLILPLLLLLKNVDNQIYSTRVFQYGYTPSYAYLSGALPAGLTVALVILFSGYVYSKMSGWDVALDQSNMNLLSSSSSSQASTTTASLTSIGKISQASSDDITITSAEQRQTIAMQSQHSESPKKLLSWLELMYGLLALFDVVVMLVANAGYLYVAVHKPLIQTEVARLALIVFKIWWNSWTLPFTMTKIRNQAVDWQLPPSRLHVHEGFLLASLMLFNNIIAPFVMTLCREPSCFYNVFSAPLAVNIEFEYTAYCAVVFSNGQCANLPQLVQLSYEPPFIYNYECRSSVLSNYVPVFLAMYIYLAFMAPLIVLFVTWGYTFWKRGSWVYTLLDFLGYGIMKDKNYFMSFDVSIKKRFDYSFWNTRVIMSNTICHIATMLTFGIAYPPLALLICSTVWIEDVQWKVLIGRYFMACQSTEIDIDLKARMLQRIERHSDGNKHMTQHSRWLLVFVMIIMFGFFVLDMVGGSAEDNWRMLVWPSLTLAAWPFALWIISRRVTLILDVKRRELITKAVRDRIEKGISLERWKPTGDSFFGSPSMIWKSSVAFDRPSLSHATTISAVQDESPENEFVTNILHNS